MSTCAFDCKDVCAGAVGDSCGGPWDLKGKCASNLKCDNDDYNEGGKCVENAEFCKETRREMQRLKEEEARAKRERGKQRERESKAKKETLKAYRIYTDAKKRGNQLNEKAKKLAKQQSSLEYSLIGCKNDGEKPWVPRKCEFSSDCPFHSDENNVCNHGECEGTGDIIGCPPLPGCKPCRNYTECPCRSNPEKCFCVMGRCENRRWECHESKECKKMKKCNGKRCFCADGTCELEPEIA